MYSKSKQAKHVHGNESRTGKNKHQNCYHDHVSYQNIQSIYIPVIQHEGRVSS